MNFGRVACHIQRRSSLKDPRQRHGPDLPAGKHEVGGIRLASAKWLPLFVLYCMSALACDRAHETRKLKTYIY